MIVVICAAGPKDEICSFDEYKDQENVVYIGVDLGAIYLLEEGIIPDLIIGDFDSINSEQRQKIHSIDTKIEAFASEKDETDTELAIKRAMKYNPKEIILTGVTGGRLDHYEAALRVVYRVQTIYENVVLRLLNNQNELRFLSPGKYYIPINANYKYLSFFAYVGDVEGVNLNGFKYETLDETIYRGSSRFTSNEVIRDDAYIEFQTGICLMIRSID